MHYNKRDSVDLSLQMNWIAKLDLAFESIQIYHTQ